MTRRPRAATRVSIAVVAAVLGALAVEPGLNLQAQAPAPGTPAAPAMSRDWKRLRTPSLTVVGNAGAGELRRVATEIERFRLALGAFAPAMRLDSPLPTTVVVFSDDRPSCRSSRANAGGRCRSSPATSARSPKSIAS